MQPKVRTRPSLTRRLGVLLGLATLTACGSGDAVPVSEHPGEPDFPAEALPPELVPDLPLVAPRTGLDIAVFSDIVDVGPGEDVTFCTFTDVILEEPRIFGQSYGAQSPQGHHAILQYTTEPREPHTGPCEDMTGQMLLGGTGGKAVADEQFLPETFGVEVPAGAQLIIDHHWINTTAEPIRGQSMMLARGLPRGEDTVLAGSMILLGLGWEIPPMKRHDYSTECTYEEDVPYVMALCHLHEWGTHVRVDVTRGDGSAHVLIDEPWTEEAATASGGGTVYSLEDPFTIRKGDTVRLTCTWENTLAEPLGFPREMCIFFGYTIGASYVCANGIWLTREQAEAAGMGSEQALDHL